MAIDPESRLVLAVVPGARDAESVEEVVAEVKDRTGGRVMDLMTSDDYPAYETAILQAYGQEVTTTATGRPSRRMVPEKVPPPGLNYATVEKRREKGRVVEIVTRVVFGTMAAVLAALARSTGEPVDQHLVPGASERDGPAPQRPEGPQDVHVLEGLACPRGDDLLHACTVITSAGLCERSTNATTRADSETEPRHGGGTGRSRLDDARMDHDPSIQRR